MTLFYRCEHCGNIITKLHDSGVLVVCCGDEMTLLTANSVDASLEKHVPVVSVDGNLVNVKIGSEPHPMLPEHYIEWLYLETTNGGVIHYFQPKNSPEVSLVTNQTVTNVYAYCNLHGLWKKQA